MKRINYILAAAVIIGVVAVLGYNLSSSGVGLHGLAAKPLTVTVCVALLLAVLLPFSLANWRRLDEGQQEAQKWGWFWGAGFGLLLPLPVVLMCNFAAPGTVFGAGLSGEQGFVLAYGTIAFSISLCYGVAWLIWWLRHR